MIKTVLLQVCMIISFSTIVCAQARLGRVMNVKNEPIDFATVVLLQEGNQAIVATTDTLGYFSLIAENGSYDIRIQNLGYKTVEKGLNITSGNADLGIFRMEDGPIKLSAVVVEASSITREADRFVMQVNDHNPAMLNKDAAEILQTAPGVWVDGRGVSINGSGGTKIFINDREIKLTSRELIDYLKNYRSSDIARVEVIPQAGAEYSAESQGGVIRISLRRRLENGINGNVMMQTAQGENYEQYKPSASINALTGKLAWNVAVSGYKITKSKTDIEETRFFHAHENDYFQSQGYIKAKPSLNTGRLGVVYDVDDWHSFGAELEYWAKNTKTPSFTRTTAMTGGKAINSTGDYFQNEKDHNFSATFNYIHKIDTIGSSFKFIVDYTDKEVIAKNDYHSIFETSYGFIDSMYRNESRADYQIYTLDVMLNKQFQNNIKLTAGGRYARNEMYNHTFFESMYNSQWISDKDGNYSLRYVENIGALYGTLAMKLGNMDILAGLRGEYVHTVGKNEFDKKNVDLFPNLSLTYAFNAMRTFMLIGQYARNIQRPNFWYLNPNRVQYSDYSYMIGNPHLRPTYINRISLTAVYKYRYTFTVGANMHNDLIREVTRQDLSDPDIKFITPENHYRENHYFVAISSPIKFANWFSVNTSFVGVKQDIQEKKGDKTKSHYLYFLNATANITLPAEFYLELSANCASRLYSANTGIEPRQLFHAEVKKKLFDNRFNVSLGIHNIFDSRAAYFAKTDEYSAATKMTDGWDSRLLKVGVQYNFNLGKIFKKHTIEKSLDIEKGRMEKTSGGF